MSDMLGSVARVADLWTREAVTSLFHMDGRAWDLPLRSETGMKTLETLVETLQLRFPVEFAYKEGSVRDQAHPMLMDLRKDESGKNVLILRHRLVHDESCCLEVGVRFLISAKMIETGFPGIMFERDQSRRRVYGEIAFQIKEPYFPGGDTLFFGRVYPYPVFRITDFIDLMFLYQIIEDFYVQEFLTRLYPQYGLGGELYEFRFWRELPYSQISIEDSFDRRATIGEVAVAAAEIKLGYARKWNRLAGTISGELSQIFSAHGAIPFLEVLKQRCDRDFVEHALSILEQLPLENGNGFGPPVLHDIYKVLNEICALYRTSKLVDLPEIERLGIGAKLSGEFGGFQGKIEAEKGPPLVFR